MGDKALHSRLGDRGRAPSSQDVTGEEGWGLGWLTPKKRWGCVQYQVASGGQPEAGEEAKAQWLWAPGEGYLKRAKVEPPCASVSEAKGMSMRARS